MLSTPVKHQIQLRTSNDEPHRVFCLSWLKATYEPCSGQLIEANLMYKQYLASMHRMGREEVISARHYALYIRTLFGDSTGPTRKAVGDKVEHHYTGIQVRAQPLPLRLTREQAAAAQEASRVQGHPLRLRLEDPAAREGSRAQGTSWLLGHSALCSGKLLVTTPAPSPKPMLS